MKKEQKKCVQKEEKRKTARAEQFGKTCIAVSLGLGAMLFCAWTYSEGEAEYIKESGYMAFEKAEGCEAFAGTIVSSKAGKEVEADVETESESETESETENNIERDTEREAVGEQGTEFESEEKTEPVTEETTGKESETEAEKMTEEETEKITEEGTEETTETITEKMTEEGTEKTTEAITEVVAETECETESGTESETESDTKETPGTEQETSYESEWMTELITEEMTEPAEETTEKATEEETETEERTEKETETEETTGKETETEETTEKATETEETTEKATEEETETEDRTEKETETEESTEKATEKVTEKVTEKATESVTETVTETESEKEAEGIEETNKEPETKQEPETDKEPETKPESEKDSMTEAEEESETQHSSEETLPEPVPVYRGEQYEIHGDENAWYRDEEGRLWVRKGSSIYVEPTKQKGYTHGGSVSDIQKDGMFTFQLKKTDEQGKVTGLSTLQQEAYFVDGEVPEARIESSGNTENGVAYSAQSATVTVTVPPDGKSGLKRISYRIGSENDGGDDGSLQEGSWTDWTDCSSNEQISISREGRYRVYVRTEDRVGNLAFSSSMPICVDCTPPKIEIEGVQNQTANSGNVPIRVKCSDSFYRPGSFTVKITGANNGKMPKIRSLEEQKDFASAVFFDFPKDKAYDDAYRLEVKAEDLAGNITQRMLDFSVNRFGSVYDLADKTKEALQLYYLTKAEDIVFLEMNIDYVGESEIFCRENGELKKLNRESDYTVELQGSSDSWKQYRYTIPAGFFEREGVYELLLASRDRAQNESDTGLQGKQVTFALDWTAPECLITGAEPLGVYEAQYHTVCVQPKDNLGIQVARIYHDSELVQTVKEEGKAVKLRLDAGQEWQTVQVYVCDLAGNEFWSPEIPIFVSNGTKEVAPYEKKRKSAQEKTEELIKKTAGYGTSKAGRNVVFEEEGKEKETEKGQEEGKQKSGESEKTGSRAEKNSLFGRSERIRRGRLLLLFGTVLFFITFLVCMLPPGKRKR